MGKVTCPGPNITQVGVGTGEAVEVGVTDGTSVGVSDRADVDVTVDSWENGPLLVGEIFGEAVQVLRGAASTEVPLQAVNNKTIPKSGTSNFFIIY